ncbi:ABC-three component system middle component 6 [Oceanobacter antarcticus]|uniref:ABC-three component system middle component 6 n=1 Tax=Oceanobacter antarcticus TaxID=3133425 RepID=UPI003A100BB3
MGLSIVKYWRGLMIINDVSEPQKSLYVIGASILSVLRESNEKSVDPIRLFDLFHNSTNKVSLTYFYLGLDWLYLLNAIELDGLGNIKLCS